MVWALLDRKTHEIYKAFWGMLNDIIENEFVLIGGHISGFGGFTLGIDYNGIPFFWINGNRSIELLDNGNLLAYQQPYVYEIDLQNNIIFLNLK